MTRSLTIGRREGDLVVADQSVSGRHARLDLIDGEPHIADLGSRSGTKVDGVKVSSGPLRLGCRIQVGNTELHLLRLARTGAGTGSAILVELDGHSRTVPIETDLTIGRSESSDVCIPDSSVSRQHATVRLSADGATIEDLGSRNGTVVDGHRINGVTALSEGSRIRLGRARERITYTTGSADGPRAVPVRVLIEGRPGSRIASIDAAPGATVGQIVAELVAALDEVPDGWVAYQPQSGRLLHPADQWSSTEILPGDRLVLGRGEVDPLPVAVAEASSPRRTVVLNQLPREVWPEPPFAVQRLDVPESTSFKGRGLQWQVAGGVGSLLVGLTLFLVGGPVAFAVITGVIGVTGIATSLLGEQSRRKHKVEEFRRRLQQLDADLGAARRRQSTSRSDLSPGTEELHDRLLHRSQRLWERRPSDPDALRLRIGTGSVPTRYTQERSQSGDTGFQSELDAVLDRHRWLDDVPILGPGADTGSVGIFGEPRHVHSLTARMIMEAALLHPPEQLRIWIAASDGSWQWCYWLPHVARDGLTEEASSATELLGAVGRHLASGAGRDVLHLVVVPDASRGVDVADLLAAGTGRVLLVATAPDQRDLPSGMSVVVGIDTEGQATASGSYDEAPAGGFAAAGIDRATLEDMAAMLAQVAGRFERSSLGGIVELLGLGTVATLDVAASWADPPASPLTVAVGTDDTGAAVTVGFREHGPHGMVAGTTGSGKSELLQTILTALTLRHGPERLNLFLIDFKGGSTFAPLAPLPHVVGVVTDLERDPSLSLRAFAALDAEIERRKRVLDAARVPDVIALARSGAEPLPDLLVVIDELALLVERQPEVRDRLDTVAAQGRSLGIHLLLSTQTPAGVITQAIRANTNLWLCLRVVTDAESVEIVGTRDASQIPNDAPGRAIIRLGAGSELRTFQGARVGRPVVDEGAPVQVKIHGAPGGTRTRSTDHHLTELDVLVAHMVDAAERTGRRAGRPLWLPPLPTHLRPDDLPARSHDPGHLTVTLGLFDDPARQVQEPYTVDLTRSGHLLVMGALGSGKSTALAQVALDLVRHRSPADVHIYGIDSGTGALRDLVSLPHVGDVVASHDLERTTRLIDRLAREMATRRDHPGSATPRLVVLLDDFSLFRETTELPDARGLMERFGSLLQGGPAVGIHIVLAASQPTDLRGRELNLIPSRLLLRTTDPNDYWLVDRKPHLQATTDASPGRGFANGAVEVQVCAVDAESVEVAAREWPLMPEDRWPKPVRALPSSIDRQGLVAGGAPGAFAVGGPEVEPLEASFDVDSPVLVVGGPRRSGRSTALMSLVHASGLADDPNRSALVLALRPSPLRNAEPRSNVEVVTDPSAVGDALARFEERLAAGSWLIADDAEALAGLPGVAERLDRLVRSAPDRRLAVAVAALSSDLLRLFEPWAQYILRLRRGLLLQPTPEDLAPFAAGVRLPPIPSPGTPGRGVLIEGGRMTTLQVAHVDPAELIWTGVEQRP